MLRKTHRDPHATKHNVRGKRNGSRKLHSTNRNHVTLTCSVIGILNATTSMSGTKSVTHRQRFS